MKVHGATLLALALVVILAVVSIAEVPRVTSYQGRLTIDGVPVEDGPKSVRFVIWDDPTSNLPANEIWNSGPVTVSTVDGLFSVNLGDASMAPFPEDPPSDTGLWLGVTVGADPEMTPRTRLTSAFFAFRSAVADTANYALDVDATSISHADLTGLYDDTHPQYLLANGTRALTANLNCGGHRLNNLATATSPADAVRLDQVLASGAPAGGDLTGTYPNPTLAAGSVGSTEIADNSIQSADIANLTITDTDISSSAAISTHKIYGTAMNLSTTQTVTAGKLFSARIAFGDSAMTVDYNGVRIGDADVPSLTNLLEVVREYSTTSSRRGINCYITNDNSGEMRAIAGSLESTASANMGNFYGVSGAVYSNGYGRRGLYGYAQADDISLTTGYSYGLYAYAYDGQQAIGVYGSSSSAETNYAGYFNGDVNVTGSVLKSGSVTLIDHPDDPENLYLAYGSVESSDFKTMLDGTAVTDGDGKAEVSLPDWFEKVNEDFRYQLTVIGSFARAIVGTELSGGTFMIMTDEPYVKVCWQVTGIRSDVWARANRIQSGLEKADSDKGLYRSAELLGKSEELSVSYRHEKDIRERRANGSTEF